MVVVRPTASAAIAPSSGTAYTASTTYGAAGSLIGANNSLVYRGTGTSVTGITALTPATQYTATAYSYNAPTCYNISSPDNVDFYTLSIEPTSHAASFTCAFVSLSQIDLTFSAASSTGGNGYLILGRTGSAPTSLPTDGTAYAVGATIGNAFVVGQVNSATATTFAATGLDAGTTYYFKLVPFNRSGVIDETINYRTSATVPGTFCSTGTAPEINVRGIIGANPTIPDGSTIPSGLNNTLYSTVVVGFNQAKSFRIENTGNFDLSVTSITKIGGNTGDFIVSGITLPATIASGGFLNFTVTFAPTAAGIRSTTLNIVNTDSNENPYDFVLQGNGTVVSLVDINVRGNGNTIANNSIYPSGLNHTAFGVATVGVTTVVRTFTIENNGSSSLTLTGTPRVSITGPNATDFTVTATPSLTIAGGGSTTFNVTFNPASQGAKNATINILSSDAAKSPYVFNISGTAKGTNNIYVYGNGNDVVKGSTTTALINLTNFGNVATVTGIKQNTFIISNLSTSTRYFSSVVVSGPDAAMFTVASQVTNNGLGTGNSTSFTINFVAASVGVKNATVTFQTYEDNARTIPESIDPSYTFAISGTGVNFTSCSFNAPQLLFQQDFEVVPATPTWGYTSTTDGTTAVAGGTFNNGSTNRNGFIGARAFQFRGLSTTGFRYAIINMNPVDVSLYSNINMSFKVGAFRTGTTQGLDVNDYIQVESSIDGGVNWSVESVLRGYSNSRWDFAATGVFNAFYTGTNNGITVDTRNGGAELSDGYATYNVKSLPASTSLMLRITLILDRIDEIWAIDNIKIEGQTPQASTWNGVAWSPSAPTSSRKAILTGNYSTLALPNIQTCECEITNTGGLTITAGKYIEVQGAIINNGNLTVLNNGSVIQVNDNSINTGTGTNNYSRTTSPYKKFDYVYWSSPLMNSTISSVFSTWRTDYAFQFIPANYIDITGPLGTGPADGFDDGAPFAWQNYTGTMTRGRGFAIMTPTGGTFPTTTTSTFTGTGTNRFNNGVVTVPISQSGNAASTVDDYNLVGNPYPSAIYADDFIAANLPNISGTLYFWTHNTAISNLNPGPDTYNYTANDYALYTYAGGAGTGGSVSASGSSAPTGYIAAGQGFMIDAENDTSVFFNNSMRQFRVGYQNNDFYRTANNNNDETATIKDRMWLNLENPNGVFSQQLLGYFENATLGYDKGYDGLVLKANSYVSFYSFIGDEEYKIQGRNSFDTSDIVPLGYKTVIPGTFTIRIENAEGQLGNVEQAVYLEDKMLGYVHDLKQGPYSFTTAIGTFNNRFEIRYTNEILGNEDFDLIDNNVIVAVSNQQLIIKSTLEPLSSVVVYDVLGREILSRNNIDTHEVVFDSLPITNQALIVKMVLQNGQVVTRKIVI